MKVGTYYVFGKLQELPNREEGTFYVIDYHRLGIDFEFSECWVA
jgi:hypothetical protein